MNKIRLYIEDQEIELQEEVQVSITRQFEEISNPTVICNDYTKTVKIPMTAHNNIIFGNIYNPDMISAAVPTNLFNDMVNGDEIFQSDNIFHTNKEYPIRYDHPEMLYPPSLYNPYITPSAEGLVLQSYTVYRGVNGLTPYETFIPATTELGRHTFTFTLDNTMYDESRSLTFKCNGTVTLGNVPYVVIELNDLEDGEYQCSFDTVLFDTVNGQFNFKNLVLTRGSEVVWGNEIADGVGIYFDPFRKLNFRLEWNGDLLMQGYSKMLSAKRENGKGYYEITLNGELGKIFQEMKKITFDPSQSGESEGKYYIDGGSSDDVPSVLTNLYMTKELVYSGFTVPQSTTNIKNSNELKVTDIIGFAPCNAFDEGFEYDTFQWENNEALKFTEVLENVGFSGETGIAADTAIPDGMTPRGIGEYRSYLQQPFIYFNKLFQIFQNKAEKLTGYKFNLDSEWFNANNPLWYRLVMMLSKLSSDKNQTYDNIYKTSSIGYAEWTGITIWIYNVLKTNNLIYTSNGSSQQKDIYDYALNNFKLNVDDNSCTILNLAPTFTLEMGDGGFNSNFRFGKENGLVFSLKTWGQNNTIGYKKVLIVAEDTNVDTSSSEYIQVIKLPSTPDEHDTDRGVYKWTFTLGMIKNEMTYHQYGTYAKLYYETTWLNNEAIAKHLTNDLRTSAKLIYDNDSYQSVNYIAYLNRSYAHFTINDLWNNDYNLFDIILNYCKMYRIYVIADPYTKQVKFIPSYKYFANGGSPIIKDWTDKVCMDKDYTVKPITWEYKYVLFNYNNNETVLGEEYREKYGVDWGEKRIITDYNFNTETKELFENISPSLVSTDNVLSWNNLYSNKRIIYSFPAEKYVCMRDKDGKYVEQFGSYYLYFTPASFDTATTLNMRSVKITDDTPFMNANNTYFYAQDQNYINVSYYPNLDVVFQPLFGQKVMCVFNKPMINYTYSGTSFNNAVDVYNKVWKKYVDERYNRNNKIVTCYIHLTPYDYINFKFNDFIKIENQLYVVNKIYDYDAVTNQKVKVDLITVQDITGYTTR